MKLPTPSAAPSTATACDITPTHTKATPMESHSLDFIRILSPSCLPPHAGRSALGFQIQPPALVVFRRIRMHPYPPTKRPVLGFPDFVGFHELCE